METNEKGLSVNRRVGVAAAAAGLYLLAFGSRRLQASTPGAGDAALASIASSALAIEEMLKKVRDNYNKLASEANEKLAFVEPIKKTFDDIQKLDRDVREKKEQVASFVNQFHRAQKDPTSFRFPSMDPFTVDLLNGIKRKYNKLEKSINGLIGEGKTGDARVLKVAAKFDAQANLAEASVRIQRTELEKLKKAAIRSAKDDNEQNVGKVMASAGTPWLYESVQKQNELLSLIASSLCSIQQTLIGKPIGTSDVDASALESAINAIKEGRGSLIDDKGGTLA